ncbi:MAG: hypothetical protein K0R02_283 [Rickettsiaceae bacterium]|jgi:ankyrin repeat protein|nr:hypothetical protein [Rickettsiaceae bacterium]
MFNHKGKDFIINNCTNPDKHDKFLQYIGNHSIVNIKEYISLNPEILRAEFINSRLISERINFLNILIDLDNSEILDYVIKNFHSEYFIFWARGKSLLYASSMGKNESVKILLNYIGTNLINKQQWLDALKEASNKGFEEVAKTLQESEREITLNAEFDDAMFNKDLDKVKLLHSQGFNLQEKFMKNQSIKYYLAENGIDFVKFFIESGIDLVNPTIYCSLLSQILCNAKKICQDSAQKELIEFLIESGANLDTIGPNGQSIFIEHVSKFTEYANLTNMPGAIDSWMEIFNLFIEKVENFNLADNKGNSAMHYIVGFPEINTEFIPQILSKLFKLGAKVDVTNGEGQTPLFLAASKGYASSVELLLQEGANLNHKDKKGNTIFDYAISNGHLHILEILLNNGYNINLINEETGNNSLMSAIDIQKDNLKPEIIKFLIEKGIDLSFVNEKTGHNALTLAIKNCYTSVAKVLIEEGSSTELSTHIDINHINIKDGSSPLIYTLRLSNTIDINKFELKLGLIKTLLEHGADIHLRPKGGNTPLEYSLSEMKANSSCRFEWSAFDLALNSLEEFLKTHKVDLNTIQNPLNDIKKALEGGARLAIFNELIDIYDAFSKVINVGQKFPEYLIKSIYGFDILKKFAFTYIKNYGMNLSDSELEAFHENLHLQDLKSLKDNSYNFDKQKNLSEYNFLIKSLSCMKDVEFNLFHLERLVVELYDPEFLKASSEKSANEISFFSLNWKIQDKGEHPFTESFLGLKSDTLLGRGDVLNLFIKKINNELDGNIPLLEKGMVGTPKFNDMINYLIQVKELLPIMFPKNFSVEEVDKINIFIDYSNEVEVESQIQEDPLGNSQNEEGAGALDETHLNSDAERDIAGDL